MMEEGNGNMAAVILTALVPLLLRRGVVDKAEIEQALTLFQAKRSDPTERAAISDALGWLDGVTYDGEQRG